MLKEIYTLSTQCMPFLRPLLAILIGFSAVAGIGSRLAQETPPPPPASVPASVPNCSAPQVQCRYGHVPDPNTGCPTDVCAPRAAGAAEETPPASTSPGQPSTSPGEQPRFEGGSPGNGNGPDDRRCLADNLRNLTRWEKDLFRGFNQQLKNFRTSKVPVPAEVTAGIDAIHQMFAQAKSAASCQELGDLNSQINEAVQPVMDQLHELEQAANDARCIKDSQRNVADFERHPFRDADRKIKQLEKQGIAAPADLKAAVEKVRDLLAQIKQATVCEDAQGLMQEVFSTFQEAQDKFMMLDMLSQMPRMIKQIERELKNTDRQWARAVKQARASTTDLSDQIAKGDAINAELRGLFDEFKSAVTAGDFEKLQTMEDRGQDAEAKRDDLFEIINTVQALANIPREIKGLDRRVADLRRQARDADRHKADASELRACLDGYGPVIANLKAVAAQKPVDKDTLADAIQNAEEEMGTCQDLADDLSGRRGVLEELFRGGQNGGPGFGSGPTRGTPQPLVAPIQ